MEYYKISKNCAYFNNINDIKSGCTYSMENSDSIEFFDTFINAMNKMNKLSALVRTERNSYYAEEYHLEKVQYDIDENDDIQEYEWEHLYTAPMCIEVENSDTLEIIGVFNNARQAIQFAEEYAKENDVNVKIPCLNW